ncbi:MAG TPA: hypothetical protein VM049_02425 [Gaiellaceae bacterium]|nr:hypothetical protein [Gaiellaceae bacterium]
MRLLLPTLGAVLVLAGCAGEAGPAGPALQGTAANLDEIESGVLSVSVRMAPKDGEEFGYDIRGPVELAGDGKFPLADVKYTQIAGGRDDTVRLVLEEDGSGWIERAGKRTDLTESQLSELRSSGSLLGAGGLRTLGFEKWIVDPKLSDGPNDTDKVTADLDVAAAMAGLSALSGALKQDVVLTAKQRKEVADAVDDSSFELLTGKEDRLLRKLALDFSLGADVPADLRDAIGDDVVGARFSFDLGLDKVNEPVRIGD